MGEQEQVDEKQSKLEEKDARIQELEAQLQRALADYANLKKRQEKEKEDMVKYSNEMLLMKLVNIFDGFEMLMNQLQTVLEENGFEKVEVQKGDKFDPNTMEATENEDGGDTVKEVHTQAYKLHDKVVRPAKVKVGEEE